MRRLTNLIAALALLTQTAACANYADRRFMLQAEKALNSGADAWEATIDDAIADCRARLPNATEAQRRECIAPVNDLDRRVVEPTIAALVVTLQTYWTATSAGDEETAQQALARAANLARRLPPESFGALQTLIGDLL